VAAYKEAVVADLARAIAHSAETPDARKRGRYIFWLGAGSSRTAGIPLAEGVVDRLLDRRWRAAQGEAARSLATLGRLSGPAAATRIAQVRQWVTTERSCGAPPADGNWGSLYTDCLASLPGELDRQEFILECVEEGRGRLNLAHLLVAQLMVSGFVPVVLTTNFDDLMLRALQLYFKFPAVVDPHSMTTLMIQSNFLQVAYLHGKLNSYRQRHTADDLHNPLPAFEPFLTQAVQDHGLVVIGYRGGDEAPMATLQQVLEARKTGPGRGLYWISHETDYDKLSPSVRTILALKDVYWIPGADADGILTELCGYPGIGLGLPDFVRDPGLFARRMEEILPEDIASARRILSEPAGLESIAEAKRESGEAPVTVGIGTQHGAAAPPEADTLARRAIDLFLADHPEQSLSAADDVIAAAPSDYKAYAVKGNLLELQNQWQEAVSVYRRAIDVAPAAQRVYMDLAYASARLGQYAEATAAFDRALQIAPADWAGSNPWSGIGDALGENQDAIVERAERVKDRATAASTLTTWGDVLIWFSRFENAIDFYRGAVAINEDDAWALDRWGDCLRGLGRLEEAIERYTQATIKAPGLIWAFADLAEALYSAGQYSKAIEAYRAQAELSPKSPWGLLGWARALTELGRQEDAIEQLRRAADLDPRVPTTFHAWGDALSDLGRYEEAIEQYRRATELGPTHVWAYDRWGDALANLRRFDEAIELYKRATQVDPHYGWPFVGWGDALRALGRRDEALEVYRRATEADPNFAWGLMKYGEALLEAGRFGESIDMFKRAAEIDAQLENAYRGWAKALKELGRHREAEEVLKNIRSRRRRRSARPPTSS